MEKDGKEKEKNLMTKMNLYLMENIQMEIKLQTKINKHL